MLPVFDAGPGLLVLDAGPIFGLDGGGVGVGGGPPPPDGAGDASLEEELLAVTDAGPGFVEAGPALTEAGPGFDDAGPALAEAGPGLDLVAEAGPILGFLAAAACSSFRRPLSLVAN